MLISRLLGSAAVALLVAGGAALADTTVTFWTFLDPAKTSPRDVALKRIIESFEKKHAGIKIKVEPQVFSELGVKFILGHNTGTAPDTVFINTSAMGGIIQSGAAADLEPLFIGRWPQAEKDDFYVKAGWDAALLDGKRYAVPMFNAGELVFYRKDLLAEAGVDPARIRTWDDLTAAAGKLTKDKTGDGRIDVWGFGTPLATDKVGGTTAIATMIVDGNRKAWDEAGCKALYANEAGVRTVKLHADWIKTHKVMPEEALVTNTDDLSDQFSAGRYAMIVAPFARYSNVQKDATWDKSQLEVLAWPSWQGDTSGPSRVAGWWVGAWSKSPRLKEAALWVEHLISPEAVRIWSTVGGQIPTRLSVWQEEEFKNPKYDYLRTLIDSWKTWSYILPTSCNTSRFDGDLNAAVQEVAVGGADPMAALKKAEAAFRERQ